MNFKLTLSNLSLISSDASSELGGITLWRWSLTHVWLVPFANLVLPYIDSPFFGYSNNCNRKMENILILGRKQNRSPPTFLDMTHVPSPFMLWASVFVWLVRNHGPLTRQCWCFIPKSVQVLPFFIYFHQTFSLEFFLVILPTFNFCQSFIRDYHLLNDSSTEFILNLRHN